MATENARRAAGTKLLASETNGAITVGPPGRPLRIEARADRIDEIEPGGWEIIDYKTGRVPSPKELDGLFAPQLLLEAAMAEQGGFEGIKGKARAVHLSYWQANGLGDGGEVKEIKGSEQLVPAMLALVAKMAEHFAKPGTPYPALPWPEYHPALQRLRPSRARRRMVDRRRRRGMSAALDALALATDAQRRATTPGHSAWVEANAGTGKTKVLTDRVTRLLLDGVKPERILCLTFTKAAAAEMRNRLASQLGRWALADAGQARRADRGA